MTATTWCYIGGKPHRVVTWAIATGRKPQAYVFYACPEGLLDYTASATGPTEAIARMGYRLDKETGQ